MFGVTYHTVSLISGMPERDIILLPSLEKQKLVYSNSAPPVIFQEKSVTFLIHPCVKSE